MQRVCRPTELLNFSPSCQHPPTGQRACERDTLSVPVVPTTVVMPPSSSSERRASGVRLEGPASPPPPATCTCMSTKPGQATRPVVDGWGRRVLESAVQRGNRTAHDWLMPSTHLWRPAG